MNRHMLSKLVGEWKELVANSTLVTNLAGNSLCVLTCKMVFQVVLLDKLLLTVATLIMTDSIMSQEVLLQAPLLCECFFTDCAGERLQVIVHSHVQLKPDSVGINLIAQFAFPVFQQTRAPLDMFFQVGKNKERLVAGSTDKPLLYVPSLVGF